MKLAISGKGGVGKTTFASLVARTLSDQNKKVLAIDADPDANFSESLGIPKSEKIPAIVDMKELISERTGAKPGTMGGFFKINPRVDDIPDTFSEKINNISLVKLGGVKQGGGGCICPESTLLKSLVNHMILGRNEWIVMDMEAGIEHLGRATVESVDKLIVVVEPGSRSIETARNIRKLASEIKLNKISVVGNKIRNNNDKNFLTKKMSDFQFLGFLEYDEALIEADLNGISPYDSDSKLKISIARIIKKIK